MRFLASFVNRLTLFVTAMVVAVDVAPAGEPPPPECPRDFTSRVVKEGNELKLVTLEWKGPEVGGLVRYHLFRNGTFIADVPAFTVRFEDEPPFGFVTRHFAVNYELVPVFTAGLRVPCEDAACRGPCEPLTTTAVVSPGTVVFYEDFDDIESDEALLAVGWQRTTDPDPSPDNADIMWTVTNQGGRPHPPTLNGRPTEGKFVISDARKVEGGEPSSTSYILTSPSFSCQDLTDPDRGVWLHFDLLLLFDSAQGTGSFDVQVRNNGGEWNTVFRRASPRRPEQDEPDRGGFLGRLDIDLTDYALGLNGVQFRLCNIKPTNELWIAVDNVTVDNVPPPQATVPPPDQIAIGPPGVSSSILAPVGFCDGIPEFWQVRSVPDRGLDVYVWDTETGMPCVRRSDVRNLGTKEDCEAGTDKFAMVDSYVDKSECHSVQYNEYLVTRALDCSQYTEVFLVFLGEALTSYWQTQNVLVSTDGGGTFDPVFSYPDTNLPGELVYQHRGFSVQPAAEQPNVRFAFRFKSDAGEDAEKTGWWAVDNVTVYGTVDVVEFKRGDANDDGSVNITDGVFVVNFLFNGGPAPGCLAAADADASAKVEITDSIYIFDFLFQGRAEPVAPFPNCDLLGNLVRVHDQVEVVEKSIIVGCERFASCY